MSEQYKNFIGFIDFSNNELLSLTEENVMTTNTWIMIFGKASAKWEKTQIEIDGNTVNLHYYGILDTVSDPLQISLLIPLKKGQTIKALKHVEKMVKYSML